MIKHELKDYLSVEDYKQFSDVYIRVTVMHLFSIQRHKLGTRRAIIRNFMAKSSVSLQSVFSLWELKNYQDCYVLLRVITDRLFHLYDLIKYDRFQEFDDWSFYQQFCSRNKIRSDKEYNHKLVKKAFDASEEEKERFAKISEKGISYRRPKPEKVSKELNIHFIYKYGYDHASTLVHPMANDGWEDLIHLTGLYPETILPDHRAVLGNSLLCNHLLHNHAMQGINLRWKKEVIDFMDDSMKFLKVGDKSYIQSFLSIADLSPKSLLCKE